MKNQFRRDERQKRQKQRQREFDADLDAMKMPEEFIGSPALHLASKCHPDAGLHVHYLKNFGKLVFHCAECHRYVEQMSADIKH
jgi:hypothetical protein